MGINTNIYLPSYIKTKDVFKVMQKSFGNQFIKTTFPRQKHFMQNGKMKSIDIEVPFDADAPCSKTNPWHLKVCETVNGGIELTDPTYFRFAFNDLAESHYQAIYQLEVDDEQYSLEPGCKSLGPPSIATWCAIGKKLVDFFGGKILYSDALDQDDSNNWYYNNKPLFPPKTAEQSSDDRWYQYYNALNNTAMISSKDIKEMLKHAAYSENERDIKLLKFLSKLEEYEQLDNKIEKKSTIKKIKI